MEKKLILKSNVPTFFTVHCGKISGSIDSTRINLAPGLNYLTELEAELLNKHPLAKVRFDKKDIEWMPVKNKAEDVSRGTSDVPQAAAFISLSTLSASAAKELIVQTLDMNTLKSWLEDETETRKGVKSAIEAQIDALTIKVEPKKEDDK